MDLNQLAKEAFDQFVKSAEEDMLPKMQDSAMNLVIYSGGVDIKVCLELGAAVLLDKPIIVINWHEKPIPENLKKIATHIIEGRLVDPGVKNRLAEAISQIIKDLEDKAAR